MRVSFDPLKMGLLCVLSYLAAISIFFRTPIRSGFDIGFSERGDGIIEISILEHWKNVLWGYSPWDTTFYFYPYSHTLGYNDGYLLYGLSYAFWRLFVDPFHADMLNILTFKTIGYSASYFLVASILRWGRHSAVLVAFLFTISSNIYLQAVHAQLQSVALVPVSLILLIALVNAERRNRRKTARCLAVILALLMAAWLLTSYYMAWFTIFSACLFVVCYLAMAGKWRPANILRFVGPHIGTLACGVLAFCLFIIPFLHLYLPKMGETGGQEYKVMLGYLVTPVIDMINTGPGNYLWGWIFRLAMALAHSIYPKDETIPQRVLGGEHETGFPVFLFILIITSAWQVLVRRRLASRDPAPIELRSFALSMMIAWTLTLQFWVASPWGLVFELVPGAKGMRVVSRYQLWLTLPFLLLVVAVWRDRMAAIIQNKPIIGALITTALILENLSSEASAQLPRSIQRAELFDIPPPPAGCSAFYVIASRRNEPIYKSPYMNERYPHNVDAMLLAELWKKPTVNGFSTFNPPDWDFKAPFASDYDQRILKYSLRHQVRHLCRLDVRNVVPWTGA